MIGYLQGIIKEKKFPDLLLEVAGVGYEIALPMSSFSTLGDIGEKVAIYTHLSVREDAHLLFGFVSRGDRQLFRSLIKTNGVGPKLALAILSAMSVSDFAFAIEHSEIARLTKIPGVGKKTAERLVVELSGKCKEFEGGGVAQIPASVATSKDNRDEAIEALVGSLGYKHSEAVKMIKNVYREGASVEELIRDALKKSVK